MAGRKEPRVKRKKKKSGTYYCLTCPNGKRKSEAKTNIQQLASSFPKWDAPNQY
jgi:hypothetical protein